MTYRTLGSFALAIAFGAQARVAAAADKKGEKKEDAPAAEEKKTEEAPEAVHDQSAWEVPQDALIPATPQRVPSYGSREDWSILPYGFAKLDVMEDSTQSFDSGIGANLI